MVDASSPATEHPDAGDAGKEWRWMIFDGASVLYVVTMSILIITLLAIFVHRQVLRLRNNNIRREPEVRLKAVASRNACTEIDAKLEQVSRLRLSYLPKLTDCTTIHQHNNAPYLHRMIAVDEIMMEIDGQMERINVEFARLPGETTLKYLMRLKSICLPTLSIPLIQRISFIHEAARHRPEKFDLQHLMELRSLLNNFLKIVNSQGFQTQQSAPTSTKGPLSQIYQLGQRLNAGSSKRARRNQFGGSDGSESDDDSPASSKSQQKGIDPGRTVPDPSRRFEASRMDNATAEVNRGEVTTVGDSGGTTVTPIRKEIVRRPTKLPAGKPVLNNGRVNLDPLRMMTDVFEDFKQMIGIVKNCLNGGKKVAGKGCVCRPHYSGAQCETKECLNGGTLMKVTTMRPPGYVCKCPHDDIISGDHCEKVKCKNNGVLTDTTKFYTYENATCKCPQWHSGRLCEVSILPAPLPYAVPIALGITVVCVFFFICFLCRLNWFRRRPSRRGGGGGHNGGHGIRAQPRRRPVPAAERSDRHRQRGRGPATGVLVQEQLLGEERGAPMRGPAYPHGVVAPYVIRLDTIPTFNPQMVGGVDPGTGEPVIDIKEFEPPPSYEQAVSAPKPPEYSPPRNPAVMAGSRHASPSAAASLSGAAVPRLPNMTIEGVRNVTSDERPARGTPPPPNRPPPEPPVG